MFQSLEFYPWIHRPFNIHSKKKKINLQAWAYLHFKLYMSIHPLKLKKSEIIPI